MNRSMFRAAALLLRRGGVRPSNRSVSHLLRLARSFQRDGVGRVVAVSYAATLVLRKRRNL